MPLPAESANTPKSKTRAYTAWESMVSRCKYPSATGYKNYGGKGIKVCDRWRSYEAFLADMGQPADGMSLDRINGLGNYEPSNCRWATKKEQLRNRCNNVILEHEGRKQCLSAWAEEAQLPYRLVYRRVRAGWAVADALSSPARPHKPYQRLTGAAT